MKNWINKRFGWHGILFILAALILQSCSSKSIIRKYYLLEIPLEQKIENSTSTISPDACEVVVPEMTAAYGQHRIAVRRRSHEISYYQYHEWAMRPGEVIGNMFLDHLKNAGLFSEVSNIVLRTVPRFRAFCEIKQLEAIEGDDLLSAHLNIRFRLFDRALERTVVDWGFDQTQPLEEKDINLFAASSSRLLEQAFSGFESQIEKYLQGGTGK